MQPFIGGTAGVVRSTVGLFTEFIVASVSIFGQLSFDGNTGAGNDITIDNIELILMPGDSVTLITGHSKFDCYLPHQNEVSVELVGFEEFPTILTVLAAAPESLHLPAPPQGYGNAGFGGISQVSAFQASDGGVDYANLPLTRKHTDPVAPIVATTVSNGMEIPVNASTAINNPGFITVQQRRDFPIVDIQFVEIEGNMPGNIKSSG